MILVKLYNGFATLVVIGTLITYFHIARSKKMEKGKAKGLLILLPASILVVTLFKDICVVLYLMIFHGLTTVGMPIVGPIGKINMYYFIAGIVAFGWFPMDRIYITFRDVLEYKSPVTVQE